MSSDEQHPDRRLGWSNMFVADADDPRVDGGWNNDERSVLVGFLSDRRLTLRMKCEGLDAHQMASKAVPPSDMSLLGLVRHLASVEQHWFQHVIEGHEIERLYRDSDGVDSAFKVEPDADFVEASWATWRAQVGRSNRVVESVDDLGQLGRGRPVPVREVLVHLIREYAQHLGHADLLRERIDGRVGQ